MFDWTQHLREQAAHLLWMASIPWATDHARLRRDEMLADPIYGAELKKELARQMREAKEKS